MRMKSGGDIILDKMEKGLTERETARLTSGGRIFWMEGMNNL